MQNKRPGSKTAGKAFYFKGYPVQVKNKIHSAKLNSAAFLFIFNKPKQINAAGDYA